MEGHLMSKKRSALKFKLIPKIYTELVRILPPRPIHDDVEFQNTMEMIECLAGHQLNNDQEDYLDALSTFVEIYENKHYPIDDSHITPLKILNHLMEEHDMNSSDLGRILGNRTIGSPILRGKRKLSKTHIKTIAKHFNLEPGLFLE